MSLIEVICSICSDWSLICLKVSVPGLSFASQIKLWTWRRFPGHGMPRVSITATTETNACINREVSRPGMP